MNSIDKIKLPIKKELDEFEKKFKDSLKSEVPLLDKIMNYIIQRKGKQMRPMLVFLCAKAFGNINEKCYRAASLIELLHTATLVHDDIVDEANFRRNMFSINAIWKNKIAVLVGDFLLSKGLSLAVENEDFELLKIVNAAVQDMSEGELLQIEKTRRLDINETTYFNIIRKKTAALIATCCASGGSAAGLSVEKVNNLYTFGENIGVAFQIKDDLFDYTTNDYIGKPIGIDLKEKKMTLPLIYTLNKVEAKKKKEIKKMVNNINDKNISEIIKLVQNEGGVEYAINQMQIYQKKALGFLSELPDNECKTALSSLINYVVNRNK
ncbi:MAG: polyprenyl synthetase [Flavobacteriales bacterium]|nr:polyprenyl synthetase [Flavobacteriales bacterium]